MCTKVWSMRSASVNDGLDQNTMQAKTCVGLLLTFTLLMVVTFSYESPSSVLQPGRESLQKIDLVPTSTSSGPFPRLLATAANLPGCKTIGQYEESRSRDAWIAFKGHLENYERFHHQQLQKLKSGNSAVRTLTWSCFNSVRCRGIGDQLYLIQQALVYAIISKRVLSLHWNPATYETMKYLQPNRIDWTYFNTSQGMQGAAQ